MTFYNKRELSDEQGRLFYFDNAKFILIFFVVLAHALSPLQSSSRFCETAWAVINYFHMPTLIFISGFFAKRYISKAREIKVQRVFTYIILYLAAQVSVSLFELFALGEKFSFSLLNARSSLWFLQCLIAWYILLPVLDYFRPSFIMPFTFIFGLFIGYEAGAANFLALSRTFVHLPFFMAGYYFKQEYFEKLFKLKFKLIGLVVIAALIAVCAIFPETSITNIITCNTPYASISELSKMPWGLMWASRLFFYVVAALLGFSFLAIVPRGRAIFTPLGSKTLSVYILHRFLYLAYLKYDWFVPFKDAGGIALICFIAIDITILLSVKPFTIPFDLLQKIKPTKIIKQSAVGANPKNVRNV